MTQGHTALYRKYRPTSFDEVRNQEHIVSVLQGAIKKDAIPHALLFAGSRGTGKTTVARIFARAVGASEVDIYEMDGASNRGIDEIRELREAVYTLPYESPYKVYIIDEVHMLTTAAFNAFLKTLEEPPAHVIFILATTDPDKLPDTILSRCQIFRFRAPSEEVIRDTVLDIAKKEKFKLGKEAAEMIAISAEGSFRDAIGITQKVIMASSDGKADADEAAIILGAPKTALLRDMVKCLHEKDAKLGLSAIASAVTDRVDMKLFLKLLLERVRVVMLYRHTQNEALLSTYHGEDVELLKQYAEDRKSPINSHLLLRLLEAGEGMGRTSLSHLPLELAIIDLSSKA